jgi:RNA polymerase sigma factor (sigma-70 family)
MTKDNSISAIFSREYSGLKRVAGQYLKDRYSEYEPEDVVQDVALNIFSRPDFNELVENYTGYIYQAVRNRIINLQARKKPVVPASSKVHDPIQLLDKQVQGNEEEQEPEYWKDEDLQESLRTAILELAPHEQAVILETEFGNKTFETLSREWDTPIGTLLARKHRALAKLRKILESERNKHNK